jgi:vancomycin resistance protein YoaR
LLNPGDIFSFNQEVGQRSRERGYREAGAFVNGRLVDQVGGGICQTASTIYDAVLRTNLEVIERRPHGMTVSYLPLGHDATIVWGQIDFRFQNNTEFPIRIEVVVNADVLTVKLVGTKLDDTYIMTDFVILSSTQFQIITQEDTTVLPGQTIIYSVGSTGYVVEVYKNLFDGEDTLLHRWSIGRDTYRVQDRIVLVPPAAQTAPESQTDNLTTNPESDSENDLLIEP